MSVARIKQNWDLNQLFESLDDPKIDDNIQTAIELMYLRIEHFKANPLNRDYSAENVLKYFDFDEISDLTAPVFYYLMFVTSLDVNNDKAEKLDTKYSMMMNEIGRKMEFISQDLKQALKENDGLYETLYNDPLLSEYKHSLRAFHESLNHQLSEEVENALDLSNRGKRDTVFYDQYTTELKYPFRGEMLTETELRTKLKSEDREVRKDAYNSYRTITRQKINKIFYGNHYFNVVSSWVNNVELRGHNSPISVRNYAEDLEDETTNTLINVTTQNYNLVSEYYEIKKQYLGLDELYDYDRGVEISAPDVKYTLHDSINTYLELIRNFDQYFYDRSVAIMEEGRMDAYPSDSKRGGAYAARLRNSGSWVLLNHQDTLNEASTLAHEFGHAMHYEVMTKENPNHKIGTPLCMAETASIFNELLLNDHLLEKYQNNKDFIIPFLFSEIDGYIGTIYRQMMYTKFEMEVHDRVTNQELLLADDFEKIWAEKSKELYPNFENTNDFYWSCIPHFRHTPFYCFTYAFGNLLALTLYQRYLEAKQHGFKDDFVEQYKTILSKTGYLKPKEILETVGIDINSPDFYQNGFNYIENRIKYLKDIINE